MGEAKVCLGMISLMGAYSIMGHTTYGSLKFKKIKQTTNRIYLKDKIDVTSLSEKQAKQIICLQVFKVTCFYKSVIAM